MILITIKSNLKMRSRIRNYLPGVEKSIPVMQSLVLRICYCVASQLRCNCVSDLLPVCVIPDSWHHLPLRYDQRPFPVFGKFLTFSRRFDDTGCLVARL